MVTRRVFCIGLLALSLTGMGSPVRADEDLKEISLLVQGMT